MTSLPHRVFGVTGWKNSGKTTLLTRLVARLCARGLSVSTLKHAHHAFDVDHEGRDSWRHRKAGATETAIISGTRWALMHELRSDPEPAFAEILQRMSPCDLVLVEGYKQERHPKIEILSPDSGERQLWRQDDTIVALACASPPEQCGLPCFGRDDIENIAEFITGHLGLDRKTAGASEYVR